jgi:hypothetical protein
MADAISDVPVEPATQRGVLQVNHPLETAATAPALPLDLPVSQVEPLETAVETLPPAEAVSEPSEAATEQVATEATTEPPLEPAVTEAVTEPAESEFDKVLDELHQLEDDVTALETPPTGEPITVTDTVVDNSNNKSKASEQADTSENAAEGVPILDRTDSQALSETPTESTFVAATPYASKQTK